MTTTKRTKAALKNVTKAPEAVTSSTTIAHVSEQTRAALDQQAAVGRPKRTDGDAPKTRAELYELAQQRDLPGRSRMGRDELARALGEK